MIWIITTQTMHLQLLLLAALAATAGALPQQHAVNSSRPGPAFPITWPCAAPEPPEPAASVHALRPGNIQVVAALGDSITTGTFAKSETLLQLGEDKGVSWLIGGDETVETVFTVANALKRFNPDVVGASTGQGNSNPQGNAAVGGAGSGNMLGQAQALRDWMIEDPKVDFANDWKLVSLWIGGNDLCSFGTTPAQYERDLEDALQFLGTNFQRIFVNLIQVIDVGLLYDVNDASLGCTVVRPTACGRPNSLGRPAVTAQTEGYWAATEKVAAAAEATYGSDNFTVVVQPGMVDAKETFAAGLMDTTYLSPDCFHFGVRGHQVSAVNAWRNLLQPVGLKDRKFVPVGMPGAEILCPDEGNIGPYLATEQNSKQ